MKKLLPFFLTFCIIACGGENSANKSTSETAPVQNEATTPDNMEGQIDEAPIGGPPAELLANEDFLKQSYGGLLVGDWQAITDGTWVLKFENGNFNQYKSDKLSSSEKYVVHLNCEVGNCTSKLGWCITTSDNCYAILIANNVNLEIIFPDQEKPVKFVKL